MSQAIESYISQGNLIETLGECMRDNKNNLGLLLAKINQKYETNPDFFAILNQLYTNVNKENINNIEIINIDESGTNSNFPLIENQISSKIIRVMMHCNWTSSEELCNLWNKMSKGNYTWNNIKIVWEEPVDYYVVINCPAPNSNIFLQLNKTIIFQMEPHMDKRSDLWGEWSNPFTHLFKYVASHNTTYNNNEWHLSKTYTQLTNEQVIKDETVCNILSTILSDNYKDPGQIKRIDFVKFLESKGMIVHVYGSNKFEWTNYKGSLPYHQKDNGLFPYKYTFNAENFSTKGYYTEKLIDGILSESLVFYNGCINIRDYIDERAYVWLELSNFEDDYNKIKQAIENNLWEERIPFIKSAKEKILNETNFFPRLEKIILQEEK
jgi:hypothetical protein